MRGGKSDRHDGRFLHRTPAGDRHSGYRQLHVLESGHDVTRPHEATVTQHTASFRRALVPRWFFAGREYAPIASGPRRASE